MVKYLMYIDKKGESMEEINIKDLFEFFISKLKIIILITLVVVLIGAIYSMFFLEPEYESTTTLVLTGTTQANNANNTQNIEGEAITQNDLNLNSKLVATYREVIKSKTVVKDVINTLDLEYTYSQLKNKISVSTVQDTEMISITVRTQKADEAAIIANELSSKFSDQIKEIYNIENISIIDKAEANTTPININIVKQVVIYILIGLVISCAIVFVMFYFDNTLKDAEQVEKLGLTVLTSIPQKIEEGGRKR